MLDIMQNYENIRQIIHDVTLMNNRFLNKALDGNIPATQRMLRIILNNDKIKIRKVGVQQWLQNLYGHSAQLDILAEDENGTQFNVEIQRNDEGASAKRARFYCGALDMHFLDTGEKYEALPEAYVIFITENDVLKKGWPIYNVQRCLTDNGEVFEDGSHVVYVNAACQDDTPLGRLMQDLNCKDPAKMHYKELADRVNYFKTSKEGGIYIEMYAKNYAEKVAEKVAHQSNVEIAKNLLAEGMSEDFIVRTTKLSLEEVRALAAKQSA